MEWRRSTKVSTSGRLQYSEPLVSIVVVCWNSREWIESCLNSIRGAGIASPHEIVVVDNDSQDGTAELISRVFPEVRLVVSEANVGYAGGTNLGVAASSGRFVLFLNNDAFIDGPSIDRMVRFMVQTPDAAAVGGRLLNPDGSFQAGHAEFSTLPQELLCALRVGGRLWPGYPSHRHSDIVTEVDWISAACLLVRRRAFEEVSGLDEQYFMYSEEVDFQFRLHRRGWKVYYLPDVRTVHVGGRSQNRWRRRKMLYRGKMLFYRKNYGRPREAALRLMLGVISLLKMVAWGAACIVPLWVGRARREWRSNCEVLAVCARLE